MSNDVFSHRNQVRWPSGLTTLTPLIGRTTACQTIASFLLQKQTRLFTLTGMGGVGKTRLALAIAEQLQKSFSGGLAVFSLVAVRDANLVLPTIAQELGLQSGSRSSILEILAAFLHKKSFLLLLDNFEQVVEAASALADLLSICPELTLLVTSRKPLQIQGESVFQVHPLPLPDFSQPLSIALLLENPSVTLFVERAQALRPSFCLTEANASVVAQICTHLEGLPLSLELAAACLQALSPQMLYARLTHRLPLLNRGYRHAPLHQQSLRQTLQWSYNLLKMPEQMLFRQICLFAGSCTTGALEAMAQDLGNDPQKVLDGLTSLLDHSLIQRESVEEDDNDEEPRWSLLETIREFGLEVAHASAERELIAQTDVTLHSPLTETGQLPANTVSLSPQGNGEHLTPRELDVLRHLSEGLTNRQIAERLVLSVVTVNTYLRLIYRKLGVSSRTAALRQAIDRHLLS